MYRALSVGNAFELVRNGKLPRFSSYALTQYHWLTNIGLPESLDVGNPEESNDSSKRFGKADIS